MNKKGITLVELLAVITILAIILVIGIPQMTKVIKKSKLGSLRDSALLIIKTAEREYIVQKTTNKNFDPSSMECSSLSNIANDYGVCTLAFDNNGKATITLKGSSMGKFANMQCTGTKDNLNCFERELLPGYSDAVQLLTSKYNNGTNSEGLIQTNGTELRYQGSNPNNYVYFNCTDNLNPTSSTCEIWRIVGVFDNRVKLVRKDSIGSFSWDTSASSDTHGNSGYGINQWGPSGTYEGADLMRELNGDYLNYNLSANANWYNGSNNSLGSGNFNKNYVLKESAQELIGEATWYTGGVPYSGNSTVTLADAYAGERGEQGKMCSSGTFCTDNVERTYTWIGKVGLIYPSDYGYASGNSNCATNMRTEGNCDSNWMSSYGWTNSPAPNSGGANVVWYAPGAFVRYFNAYSANGVRPSVYLISDIQIKGSGTTSDPYVFAE